MMEYTIALGEGVVPLNIFNLYLIGAVIMYVLAFSYNYWFLHQYPKLDKPMPYLALTCLPAALMWPLTVLSLALYGVALTIPAVRRVHQENRLMRESVLAEFR